LRLLLLVKFLWLGGGRRGTRGDVACATKSKLLP
jgi:hypothetical protein